MSERSTRRFSKRILKRSPSPVLVDVEIVERNGRRPKRPRRKATSGDNNQQETKDQISEQQSQEAENLTAGEKAKEASSSSQSNIPKATTTDTEQLPDNKEHQLSIVSEAPNVGYDVKISQDKSDSNNNIEQEKNDYNSSSDNTKKEEEHQKKYSQQQSIHFEQLSESPSSSSKEEQACDKCPEQSQVSDKKKHAYYDILNKEKDTLPMTNTLVEEKSLPNKRLPDVANTTLVLSKNRGDGGERTRNECVTKPIKQSTGDKEDDEQKAQVQDVPGQLLSCNALSL
ncbi:hypothetical protein BDA99DRAFT_556965 [Phascolomyces articulosus]|uniref:Uncharacterized protein n=1 Tax=Phascolomyces articulosus TaxID=60185 RepID=A0AAD5KN87_9FUNG|nr:hypothetical protein BDA99DRAFT_556965 [Phascolomyces articulosus]